MDAFAVHRGSGDGRQSYCRECAAEVFQERKARPEYEAFLERRRVAYQRDREKVLDKARERRTNHPEKVALASRKWALKAKYGLTLEQWHEKYADQNGQCAICLVDIEPNSKSAHVDHDHYNGKVRALLCSGCNTGIGSLQDSAGVLRRAAEYVEFWAVVHDAEVVEGDDRRGGGCPDSGGGRVGDGFGEVGCGSQRQEDEGSY